jgi:hypothetical protein
MGLPPLTNVPLAHLDATTILAAPAHWTVSKMMQLPPDSMVAVLMVVSRSSS